MDIELPAGELVIHSGGKLFELQAQGHGGADIHLQCGTIVRSDTGVEFHFITPGRVIVGDRSLPVDQATLEQKFEPVCAEGNAADDATLDATYIVVTLDGSG